MTRWGQLIVSFFISLFLIVDGRLEQKNIYFLMIIGTSHKSVISYCELKSNV